jgi:TIR domain
LAEQVVQHVQQAANCFAVCRLLTRAFIVTSNQKRMTAFISYSHTDRALTRRLAATLRGLDLECWWDDQISLSSPWNAALELQLESATSIVTLWTKSSVLSDWVAREATHGATHAKLVQIRFANADLPSPFAALQAADVPVWEDNTFPRGIRLALNSIAQLQGRPQVLDEYKHILRRTIVWGMVMQFIDQKKHCEKYFPKLDGPVFKDIWEMSMDKRIKLYDELHPATRSTVDEERYYELIEYLSEAPADDT